MTGTYVLRTDDQLHYLRAVDGGLSQIVDAHPTTFGPDEVFTVVPWSGRSDVKQGDVVSLLTRTGSFVKQSGGIVVSDTYLEDSAKWRVVLCDLGRWAFQNVANERYMTAEGGGKWNVTCIRSAIGTWETFSLQEV